VTALSGECAAQAAMNPADPSIVDRLAGQGRLASRDAFLPRGDVRSAIAPWLIGLAILLAIAELFVRRRRRNDAIVMRKTGALDRAA
jgi:hypothetical protein